MLRRRIWERVVTGSLLAVGLLAPGLVGCSSPNPRPSVALHRTGDQLEAIFAVCGGDDMIRMSLYISDNSTTRRAWSAEPSPRSGGTEAAGRESPNRLLRYRLFDLPPGWELRESDLSTLGHEHTYGLSNTTSEGRRGLLRFTLSDTESLGDTVWVMDGSRGTAMNVEDFSARAFDDC